MQEGINPGDKVVALASAARSAAVIAGAVSAALSAWIAEHKPIISVTALIIGAIVGWFVGTVVGKVFFTASDGKVMVTKAGLRALPMILKGNVLSSLPTGFVVCALVVLITNTDVKTIAILAIGFSVVIGVILAFLGSLL